MYQIPKIHANLPAHFVLCANGLCFRTYKLHAAFGDISYRLMMGEYILYYKGKVFGGIYDNRFLVKITKSSTALLPNASKELPYEGAKEMLLVDEVENKNFLRELIMSMCAELPKKR